MPSLELAAFKNDQGMYCPLTEGTKTKTLIETRLMPDQFGVQFVVI
jgi:hypothetical protein